MARLILVTGGSRSGKSSHAQSRAEALPGPRLYLATSPVTDGEMAQRIAQHRQQRDEQCWRTVEEQCDLAGQLSGSLDCPVVLVDCLTLWVNNLQHAALLRQEPLEERAMAAVARRVLDAARLRQGTVFFVTNEVGFGIVPDNAAARAFRDLAGRCNQIFGAAVDELVLVCCGVPLWLKGQN